MMPNSSDALELQPFAPLGPQPVPNDGGATDQSTTFVKSIADGPGVASSDSARDYAVVDDNVGARLDHFELLDCIGVGGMGKVYRALDTRLDRMVAVKVLAADLAGDSEVLRRFEQEAKAAARIDSVHFARVYFFGADKGKHYIAMEFVEGDDLRRRISRSGRMSVAEVVRIGVQIARGLMHSERCGVVHRDIKPSNIIVTPQGVAKLVDMGLARSTLPRANADDDITQAGVTLGTFDYISPEQSVDPRNADIRSDIYSLGCTMFHAIAGRPPYGDGSPLQKLMQHQHESMPDIRQFAPDAPAELVAMLGRMTAKDPALRYQSPAAALADLTRLAKRRGIALDEFGDVAVNDSALRHWRDHLAWAGPALMVCVAAFAMSALQRPRQRPTTLGPLLADASREEPTRSVPAPAASADVAVKAPVEVPKTPVRPGLDIVDVPPAPVGDLRLAIAAASKGQILRLLGASYRIAATADSPKSTGIVVDKDLTIRGLRSRLTTIELVDDPAASPPSQIPRSTFAVTSGILTLEDLRFVQRGPATNPDGPSYISVEGGACDARRCCFAPLPEGADRNNAAVQLTAASGAEPAHFTGSACYFSAGAAGIQIEGAGRAGLKLSDCAFRDIQRPLARKGTGPVSIALDHVSFFATDAPILTIDRLEGLTVEARESVFSQLVAADDVPLVHIELPGARGAQIRNWWTGERNLYHGFEGGLVEGLTDAPNSDFEVLARVGFREAQSKLFRRSIWPWLLNDPRRDAGGTELESFRGFRLSVNSEGLSFDRAGEPIGVRTSPWAELYESKEVAVATPKKAVPEAAVEPEVVKAPRRNDDRPGPPTLLVDPTIAAGNQPRGVYRNLHTACEEAPTGGVIELKGDRDFAAADLRIAAKRLTVRSTAGSRARLILDFGDEATATPRLSLGGGADLRLEDLAISVRNPPRVAVALIELAADASITLENCQVEVVDAEESSLFGLRAAPQAAAANESHPSQIVLRRCQLAVATAARYEAQRPVAFLSEDSRWTCDQAMFRVEAGGVPFGAGDGRNRSIALLRSTVLARDSLLVCTGADRFAGESPINLEVSLDQTAIVALGGAPLARLATTRAGTFEQANLSFKGQNNFFAGVDVFLQVAQSDAAGMLQRPYKFAEWLERTQLDRDTNQAGDGDPAHVFSNEQDRMPLIGSEELRRLGYSEKFAKPPGVDAASLNAARRSEPTR